MKKLIPLILAAAMLLSLGSTVLAADFSDVRAGSWYAPYVDAVTAAGLMNGTGKGFDPEGTLSRAMFVTILYRAAGSPATGSGQFSDVAGGSWYENAVAWASKNAIVTGYPDGRFGVNDPLTREQMMTLLYRYAQSQGYDTTQGGMAVREFADYEAISEYARPAMGWGVNTGLLTGADNRLSPAGTTTRAQAAAVLVRFLEQYNPVLTRADLEKAVVSAGWSYFAKSGKMQYCSAELTDGLNKYYGGVYRLTEGAAPEYGTSDTTIYSVCSDYVYKTYYSALRYQLFDSPDYLDATTAGLWAFCENYGALLIRCASSKYKPSDVDLKEGIDPSKFATVEEVRAFLADWKNTLRPGDVLLPFGHAMLYVGDGYVLDCRGGKYDKGTGEEDFEKDGSVRYTYKIEEVYLDGTDPHWSNYVVNDDLTYFAVIRPMNILVQDDGDGDPANDKCKDPLFSLPASILTREQNPMLEIDRTVDRSPYGTTFTGDTLTYQVKITNKSNDPLYVDARRPSTPGYAGEAYKDLTVTERIPAGTELVAGSITGGGTEEMGLITWKQDIAPGESAVLTYKVTVTAAKGAVITSGGGFVNDIPMNTIEIAVGGSKLPADAVSGFAKLGQTPANQWREIYNLSALSADTEFAERVYAKAAGLTLELPSVDELVKGLFSFKNITGKALSRRYSGTKTAKLLTAKSELPEAAKMIVPGFYGGKKLYGSLVGERINEFHLNYTEPGDILVQANIDSNGKVAATRVSVFLDKGIAATVTNKNKMALLDYATELMLWKSFSYDVFFLLRPTLSNTTTNIPYAGEEPTYGEEPSQNPFDGYAPISAENQEKFKALTSVTDWTAKNTSFAEEVYDRVGLDLNALTQSNSLVNILKKTFTDTGADETKGLNYQYAQKYEATVGEEAWMCLLIPGYWGGPDFLDNGTAIAAPTLEELEIGDLLFIGRRSNSQYWTAVYLGDGKLLTSEYVKDQYQTYKVYDFKDKPAEYQTFLKTCPKDGKAWSYYIALRPAQAFKDINKGK